MDEVRTAKTTYDNATNAREITFAPLKKLSTRVVNSLASKREVARQTVDDAHAICIKIQGSRRKKAVKTGAEAEPAEKPATISTSQQSFYHHTENFSRLIKVVVDVKQYTPQEEDLQITSLETVLSTMKNKSNEVITATVQLSNTRIARNKLLYDKDTGIYGIARTIKSYVKSVYGAASPRYKRISKIRFRIR